MWIDCPPRPSAPAQWSSRPFSRERPSHHRYPEKRPLVASSRGIIEASIPAFETTWRSFQRPPASTSVPISPCHVAAGGTPSRVRVSLHPGTHAALVTPKGSNNVAPGEFVERRCCRRTLVLPARTPQDRERTDTDPAP